MPDSRIPKRTPLRAIAVTMLLPATPCAASSMLLHAAMDRLRKVWSLPATKRTTRATRSPGRPDSTSAGSSFLMSSPLAAALRLWTSSPMCSACAMSGLSSTGPAAFRAAANAGPSTSAIQRNRSITSGLLAPKRSTLPSPSFMFEKLRRPLAAFSTIHTGIDGLMMPAIGPTAP